MFDLSEDWIWRSGEILMGLKRAEIEGDPELKRQFIDFMNKDIRGINSKLDNDIDNIIKKLKGE